MNLKILAMTVVTTFSFQVFAGPKPVGKDGFVFEVLDLVEKQNSPAMQTLLKMGKPAAKPPLSAMKPVFTSEELKKLSETLKELAPPKGAIVDRIPFKPYISRFASLADKLRPAEIKSLLKLEELSANLDTKDSQNFKKALESALSENLKLVSMEKEVSSRYPALRGIYAYLAAAAGGGIAASKMSALLYLERVVELGIVAGEVATEAAVGTAVAGGVFIGGPAAATYITLKDGQLINNVATSLYGVQGTKWVAQQKAQRAQQATQASRSSR